VEHHIITVVSTAKDFLSRLQEQRILFSRTNQDSAILLFSGVVIILCVNVN
jgi:hypothetical protein